MNFFDFPQEIRLQIYLELLVEPNTIDLNAEDDARGVFRYKQHDATSIYPVILRLNKRMHDETSPILYSHNRISIMKCGVLGPGRGTPLDMLLGQVLSSYATHIRYLRLPFPRVCDPYGDTLRISEWDRNDLRFLRNNFPHLTTLEFYFDPYRTFIGHCRRHAISRRKPGKRQAYRNPDNFTPLLNDIQCLREVIVHIQVGNNVNLSKNIEQIRGRGWTAKITRLPQRTWTSRDKKHVFATRREREDYDRGQ